jgi:hypothetical protein
MNNPNTNREVDPYADTMRVYIGDMKLPPLKRRGLGTFLRDAIDAVYRRASESDALVQILTIPSTATIAAIILSAVVRTLRG